MNRFNLIAAMILFWASPVPAGADVEVVFVEGAPTDSLTIRNRGACPLGPVSVTIDLSTTAGGLFFDTSEHGAGLSTYQPVRPTAGGDRVRSVSRVVDGTVAIAVSITSLGPGEVVEFAVDLDDSRPDGPTIIDGAEIAGGHVTLRYGLESDGAAAEARFGTDGRAVIVATNCLT